LVSAIQKPYITESEINQLNKKKELIQHFCQGIKLISFPPSNDSVSREVFAQISDLLGNFKLFTELFV